MIRLNLTIDLRYEVLNQTSDFIFNIHPARTKHQSLVRENMLINQTVSPNFSSEKPDGSRFMQLQAAPGLFSIDYSATVDIDHHIESPARIEEIPIRQLPPNVISYIYPSRYCESDRLHRLAGHEFGHLKQGYWRVQAIQEWVKSRTSFVSGSSRGTTSAMDTLVDQVGVCRDFAHLMIALCRAVNIPARFVTGIDYGADPALGPTDFHAYVEVYIGHRWYLFDPTGVSPPMGLVRIGTGRDAADVPFATIFGQVNSYAPVIHIEAVDDIPNGYFMPLYSAEGISSMANE